MKFKIGDRVKINSEALCKIDEVRECEGVEELDNYRERTEGFIINRCEGLDEPFVLWHRYRWWIYIMA